MKPKAHMKTKAPTTKQRLRKLKKRSIEKLQQTKVAIKQSTNINRYNKYLFILETILLVGVVDEYVENLIIGWTLGVYLNTLLIMIAIAIMFSLALRIIEPLARGTVTWLVRLTSNKVVRVTMHVVILCIIFYLYGKVFFGVDVGIDFSVGLKGT
ncbi:MAG: hypothetical protein ABIC95_03005 [archaeon]